MDIMTWEFLEKMKCLTTSTGTRSIIFRKIQKLSLLIRKIVTMNQNFSETVKEKPSTR